MEGTSVLPASPQMKVLSPFLTSDQDWGHLSLVPTHPADSPVPPGRVMARTWAPFKYLPSRGKSCRPYEKARRGGWRLRVKGTWAWVVQGSRALMLRLALAKFLLLL